MEEQAKQTSSDTIYAIAVMGLLVVCSISLVIIAGLIRYLEVML